MEDIEVEHRIAELHKVRSLLAASNPEDVDLEQKIKQTKEFILQNYPQVFDEFDKVAIEPSKTESSVFWSGGTIAEFEVFVSDAVREQSSLIDANRINAVVFLDRLMADLMSNA